MKSIKTNKIISFVLAVVMLFSSVAPSSVSAFSYFNEVNDGNVQGSENYTDSGNSVTNPTTGTDLDNFKVNMTFGTIDSPINGDTATIKDQSVQIPVVINIEYKGNQSYNAGDLTMVLTQKLNPMVRNSYPNCPDSLIHDVGAEEKGSNSGRGDWFYKIKNTGTLSPVETITLTNKAATSGAFTSSIEVIFQMPSVRYVVDGFTGSIDLGMTVKGLGGELNTRTLTVNTNTTHDEYTLNSIETKGISYTSYGDEENIGYYNGYSLNDYHIMRLDFKSTATENHRGSEYHSEVIFPEGVKWISGRPFEYDNNLEAGLNRDTENYMYIAIPISKYADGDLLPVTWKDSAKFLDTNEPWEQTINQDIVVKKVNITYQSGVADIRKGIIDLYQYKVNSDEGKTFRWPITVFLNNITSQNAGIEDYMTAGYVITDDNMYATTSQQGSYRYYRDLSADELYLKYIEIEEIHHGRQYAYGSDNLVTFKLYAKKANTGTWTLVKEVTSEDVRTGTKNDTYYKYQIPVNEAEKYQHFKIEVDGRTMDKRTAYSSTTDTQVYRYYAGYHITIDPETESHLNNELSDMKVSNEVKIEEKLVNGNTLKDIATGTISFIQPSGDPNASLSSQSYQLRNERIYYTLKGSFDHGLRVDEEDYDMFTHNNFLCEFRIPSYFEFDIQDIKNDVRFNMTNGYVVREATGEVFYYTDVRNNPDRFYDLENSTYEIKYSEDGKQKILNLDIKLNEGYLAYGNNVNRNAITFFADVNVYMDLDTYSGLLYLGKLPTSVNAYAYNYKYTEGPFSVVNYKYNREYSYSSLRLPALAGSTYEGVEKYVNTVNGFTKDLQAVENSKPYSYKLRVAGGQTNVGSIVIYDNLEEAYGNNEYWKGTFAGLDTTLLDMYFKDETYTYTVYYSADKSQAFDLTDEEWIKAEEWTDELSAVKSIAVDLGEFVLPTKSIVYVVVNMIAPENSKAGVRAYNSYAADYKAYDVTTGQLMENITALDSNTVEVIINKPINYTVNKVWQGGMGSAVNVDLLANSEVKETISLSTENNWTYTFNELPAVDEDYNPITYTVKEIVLDNYTVAYNTTVDNNGNITTTITNTKIPEYNYIVEKEWKVNDVELALGYNSEFGIEKQEYINLLEAAIGSSIKVAAYKEGTLVDSFDITLNSNNAIVVPDEFKTCDEFKLDIVDTDTVYHFVYEVEKVEPIIPDSIEVTPSEGAVFNITKDNQWQYSFISRNDSLTFEETPINGWTSSIAQVGDNKHYQKITNEANVVYDVSSELEKETWTYNFEKFWHYDDKGLTLGYNAATGLTEPEFNTVVGNKMVFVYASGSGLEDTSFEVNVGLDGKIVIPEQYNSYTNFQFTVREGVFTYTFNYTVSKTAPVMPTSIKLIGSDSSEIILDRANNWKTSKQYNNKDVFFTEPAIDNWTSKINHYIDKENRIITVNVSNRTDIIYSYSVSMEEKEYTYMFEKIWTITTPDLTLGYNEGCGIDAETYKNVMANQALTLHLNGEGLQEMTLYVSADADGNFVIPAEYTNYSTVETSIYSGGKTYNFLFNISKSDPSKPESITLISSEDDVITLKASEDWATEFKSINPDLFFEESDVNGWTLKEIIITHTPITGYALDPEMFYEYKLVSVENTADVIFTSDLEVTLDDYTYNFEKVWEVNHKEYVIGYEAASGLTEREYKDLIAGKNLSIAASDPVLGTTSFEVVGKSDGNIVIPVDYAKYTTFKFTVRADNVTYYFTVRADISEPEIPSQIILDSSMNDEIVLKAEKDWRETFTSNYDNLTFTERAVGTWETTITPTRDGNTFNVRVNNKNTYTYEAHTQVEKQEYVYKFNKSWNTEHKAFVLGYNVNCGLTVEAYKEVVANKELNITASGEGLTDEIFTVQADENGEFVIPVEYAGGYTDFAFTLVNNNQTYNFRYTVSYNSPDIPESIILNSSRNGEIAVLKVMNWKETYTSIYDNLTFVEVPVENWSTEINFEKTGDYEYTININNSTFYNYNSDVELTMKEYTYNFEKNWEINHTDFILGYNAASGLTPEAHKAIVGNKELTITATGEGLQDVTFEVAADVDGKVVISKDYALYDNFTFTVQADNLTYIFNYEVSYTAPVIPESITLGSSQNDVVVIKEENSWKETLVSTYDNLTFTETVAGDWNSVIDIVRNGDTFIVRVDNSDVYSYTNNLTVIIKDYHFNFEKDWVAENISFTLGYDPEFILAKEDYVELMAGRKVTINYYGFIKGSFEATYDMNGNVTIPAEYAKATTFEIVVEESERTYTFVYDVDKVEPIIPDEIKLISSKNDEVTLTKENDWKATYKFNDPTITFEEVEIEGFSGIIGIKLNEDNTFTVEVINTGNYSYKPSGDLKITEKFEPVEILKTWVVNTDNLKFTLTDSNGNKVDFVKIEILSESGFLLETILKSYVTGDVIQTVGQFQTDKNYQAKIYMADGTERIAQLNKEKFVVTSIEVDVYADGEYFGTYTLTSDNKWQCLAKLPADKKIEYRETTQGEWKADYEKADENEIINIVQFNCKVDNIVIPSKDVPVDTGDNSFDPAIIGFALLGIATATGIILLVPFKKKKKEDK